MSNLQIIVSLFLASMFPTLMLVLWILLNRMNARELRREISAACEILARLETGITRLEADIK